MIISLNVLDWTVVGAVVITVVVAASVVPVDEDGDVEKLSLHSSKVG